jgi:DNA-binding XRE family transcriptional regulator
MSIAEELMARIKARPDFSSIIARAGLTRTEVAKAAGVSTRTLDSLARPSGYGREGFTRESTAWKIARGFAQLTNAATEAAFAQLFLEAPDQDEAHDA